MKAYEGESTLQVDFLLISLSADLVPELTEKKNQRIKFQLRLPHTIYLFCSVKIQVVSLKISIEN